MSVETAIRTGFEGVKQVLRDYVDDDRLVTLAQDTTLTELGLEDIDLLNILHDMGVDAKPFIIDYETRTLQTHDIFSRLGAYERTREDSFKALHLKNLSRYDTAPQLLNEGYMNVGDLVTIADYSASCRDCSTA
jgi:hypothetical protein